jgi:hypothetical protein
VAGFEPLTSWTDELSALTARPWLLAKSIKNFFEMMFLKKNTNIKYVSKIIN